MRSLDQPPRWRRRCRAATESLELRVGGIFPPGRNRRQSSPLAGALEGKPAAVEAPGETNARDLVRQSLPPIGPAALLDRRWVGIVIDRAHAADLARTPVRPLGDDGPRIPQHAARVGEGSVAHEIATPCRPRRRETSVDLQCASSLLRCKQRTTGSAGRHADTLACRLLQASASALRGGGSLPASPHPGSPWQADRIDLRSARTSRTSGALPIAVRRPGPAHRVAGARPTPRQTHAAAEPTGPAARASGGRPAMAASHSSSTFAPNRSRHSRSPRSSRTPRYRRSSPTRRMRGFARRDARRDDDRRMHEGEATLASPS